MAAPSFSDLAKFINALSQTPLYTSGAEGEDIDPQVRADSILAASEGIPAIEDLIQTPQFQEMFFSPDLTGMSGVGGGFGGGAGTAAPDISTAPAETQEVVSQLLDTFRMFQEGATNYQNQDQMALAQGQGRPLNEFLGDSFDDYLKAQESASGGNQNLVDPNTAPQDDKEIMEAIVDMTKMFNAGAQEWLEKQKKGEAGTLLESVQEQDPSKFFTRYQEATGPGSQGADISTAPPETQEIVNQLLDTFDIFREGATKYQDQSPMALAQGQGRPLNEFLGDSFDDYLKAQESASGGNQNLVDDIYNIDNTEGGAGAGILPGKPTTPDPTNPEAYQAWIDSPTGRRYLAEQANARGGAANNPFPNPYHGPVPGMDDYLKTAIGSGAEGIPQEFWDAIGFLQERGLIDAEGNFIGGDATGTGDLTWTPPDYPFWDDIMGGQQTLFDILSGTADIPYLNDILADLELDIDRRAKGLEQSLTGRGIAGSTLGEAERNVLATEAAGDRARTKMAGLASFLPMASNFYTGMTGQGAGLRSQSLNEFGTLLGLDEALKTGASNRTAQGMSGLLGALGIASPNMGQPNVNIPNVPTFGQSLGALGGNILTGMIQNPSFNPWSTWFSGGGGSGISDVTAPWAKGG